MLGGFLSLGKSDLIPSHTMEFLGFLLDSEQCIIAVPTHKYIKCMDLIRKLQAEPERKLCVKTLERIRVSLSETSSFISLY